jgi:hypothetical protein
MVGCRGSITAALAFTVRETKLFVLPLSVKFEGERPSVQTEWESRCAFYGVDKRPCSCQSLTTCEENWTMDIISLYSSLNIIGMMKYK